MPPSCSGLPATTGDAETRVHLTPDLGEALDLVVRTARDTVPGADEVGVSICRRDRTIETVAATADLVYTVDQIQYELMEGPCVDAIRQDRFDRTDDLAVETRWPRFSARVLPLGVRAQMGIQLYTDRETLGSLNLYSRSPQAFDATTQHAAHLFAAQAALALGRALKEEQLNTALGTRKTIGQALGIVMERYQIDEERAFAFLARMSQNANIKLNLIAQQVVDQLNRDAPRG